MFDQKSRRRSCGFRVIDIAVDQNERVTALDQQHDLPRDALRVVHTAPLELFLQAGFDCRFMATRHRPHRMPGHIRQFHDGAGKSGALPSRFAGPCGELFEEYSDHGRRISRCLANPRIDARQHELMPGFEHGGEQRILAFVAIEVIVERAPGDPGRSAQRTSAITSTRARVKPSL